MRALQLQPARGPRTTMSSYDYGEAAAYVFIGVFVLLLVRRWLKR